MNEPAEIRIRIAGADVNRITDRLMELFGRLQNEGETVDTIITGALYACGVSIALRKAILRIDAPLREALPPVVAGYQTVINSKVS